MKILFATSELAPWVRTGGLGDVAGALPAALRALGHKVRVLVSHRRPFKFHGQIPLHGHRLCAPIEILGVGPLFRDAKHGKGGPHTQAARNRSDRQSKGAGKFDLAFGRVLSTGGNSLLNRIWSALLTSIPILQAGLH